MAEHDPVWLRRAQQFIRRNGRAIVIGLEGKIDVRSRLEIVDEDKAEIIGYYTKESSREQMIDDVAAYKAELNGHRYIHVAGRK